MDLPQRLIDWMRRSVVGIRFERWLFRRLFAVVRTVRPVWRLPDRWFLPRIVRRVVLVTRYRDLHQVLANPKGYSVSGYGSRMRETGADFFLGHDAGPQRAADRAAALAAMQGPVRGVVHKIAFDEATRMIEIRRAGLRVEDAGNGTFRRVPSSGRLDVVADLADLVPVHVAERYFGLANPGGRQLLEWIQLTSFYIFNPFASDADRRRALRAGQEMQGHVRRVVEAGSARSGSVLGRLIAAARSGGAPFGPAERDAVARTITGLVAGSLGPPPRLFAKAVDRLLDLRGAAGRDLRRAAREGDSVRVRSYLLEAGRMAPDPVILYRRCTAYDETRAGLDPIVRGGKERAPAESTLAGVRLHAGDTVVGLADSALMDPRSIRSPKRFLLDRPAEERMIFGHGEHFCVGDGVGMDTLTGMAQPLFALERLRRVRGRRGMLQSGARGRYPHQNYPAHLIVRFDPR